MPVAPLSRLVFVPQNAEDTRVAQDFLSEALKTDMHVGRAFDSGVERLEATAQGLHAETGKPYRHRRMADWLTVDVSVGVHEPTLRNWLAERFGAREIWRSNLHTAPPMVTPAADGEPTPLDGFQRGQDRPGGAGQHVGLIVIDAGWDRLHPELLRRQQPFIDQPFGGPDTIYLHHGVRALCTTVGRRGIAPEVDHVAVVPSLDAEGRSAHALALQRALSLARCGDVILFETQDQFAEGTKARETGGNAHATNVAGRLAPSEVDAPVHWLLELAAHLGVVVIQPAGNGGVQIPGTESRVTSVKVGSATLPRGAWVPARASNSGKKVAVYGPDAIEAGSIERDALTGDFSYARATFGNTSGASAVIAGVALAVQSAARHARGAPLSVPGLHAALSDHGLPVEGGGTVPDVARILASLEKYPLARCGC